MSTRDEGGMARVLHQPLRIGGATLRNRLYRAPVLEGAGDSDDAAEAYSRHFVDNAGHGVGLIIQGSSCIWPEGRTSPGMTCVDTREKVMRLAPMVDAVHEAGASIFLQLGHGGIYAMEAWHEPYASNRCGRLLAASPLPWLLRPTFRGVPIHVMTTDEVKAMAVRYGEIAAWTREAGYDGIQLGSANAKLLDQFLSPFYNRRTDEFGGSLERRASILRLIRECVAERAGSDYPCTVKVPAETAPPGFPRATEAEVHAILDDGQADMVGIGRPFYAEADLAARILGDDPGPRLCRNSNRCVPAQMLGMPGVCYNPEVNKARAAVRT